MRMTKKQEDRLKRLADTSDEKIDKSDIPERTDWTGGARGKFWRPETRLISIRLSAEDLAIANQLAAAKGLPYQTYLKSLLHQALVSEIQGAGKPVTEHQ